MVTSFSGIASHHHYQPLTLRITIGESGNMSHRSGQDLDSRAHDSGRASKDRGFSNPGGSSPYPFISLSPAGTNALSRRHSMTVQDMLNPSDEDPRPSSQSRSTPSSSDNESIDSRISKLRRVGQPPRSVPRSHSSRAIGRSIHQASRRQRRRPSPSSSSSEAGERRSGGFRKPYTVEETHFIW